MCCPDDTADGLKYSSTGTCTAQWIHCELALPTPHRRWLPSPAETETETDSRSDSGKKRKAGPHPWRNYAPPNVSSKCLAQLELSPCWCPMWLAASTSVFRQLSPRSRAPLLLYHTTCSLFAPPSQLPRSTSPVATRLSAPEMADHSGGRGGAPRGAFRTQRGAGRRRSQRRGGAAPAAPPQPPTTASNRGGGAGRGRGGKKRGGGKGKGKGNGNGTPAVPVVPDYTPTTAAPLPPALVDIGLNLTSRKFHHDRDEVMARAVSVGVRTVVLTGCEMRGNLDASKYAVQAADRARAARARGDTAPQALVFSTAGFHPHNAKQLRIPTDIDKLRELCAQPHVVAVGECGLDYNRDFSPRDVQVAAFKAQIQLAIELGMPMFVHERDAHDDLMACFDSFDAATLPDVVVHCFTGSEPALRAYIDRGFYIGLTGTLCMSQRGRELRRIASTIPLDRLMIETDAPFMSPVKSVRRCEPMHMVNVCEGVAKAYGLPYAQIAAATTANAARFFRFSDAFKAMKAGTAGGKATVATPPPPHVPPRSASAAGAGGGAGAGSGVYGDTTAAGAPASKPGVSAKTAPGSHRGSGSGGDSSSYVDTHCHLDTVLQRLKLQSLATLRKRCPAGLEGVVAIFCDPAAFSPSFGVWRSMLDEPGVYGAFGIVRDPVRWRRVVDGIVVVVLGAADHARLRLPCTAPSQREVLHSSAGCTDQGMPETSICCRIRRSGCCGVCLAVPNSHGFAFSNVLAVRGAVCADWVGLPLQPFPQGCSTFGLSDASA